MSKPSKVLIIGSGPIVIGQAAEFDYAGTQACKAMREEGVVSVLVNSNPATIMTDTDIADIIYIEPLTVPVLERIIARERPDGLLPTLGGQTGLNLAVALADAGILDKYNVRLLGTPLDTIRKAEDRELFKVLLQSIGEPVPPSMTVTNQGQAARALRDIGLPLVIRPAYTLGGTGGGIANTLEEYHRFVASGLLASPIGQVLVERSLVGWKEIEYEVMRDGADTCITVCNMENFDPMGVHTGDSIVVAPSQTLTDKEYQTLRTASIKIIRALGIEGGCNVQYSMAPRPLRGETYSPDGQQTPYFVIEVNPRVSRSSALASKATGYPIARMAAKIAVGKRLDEITNPVTGVSTAAFEPALDYCVVKIPRWPFDKFASGDRTIGTQMKATGEVMAIGRTFESALGKAIRSWEVGGRTLQWEDASWGLDQATDPASVMDRLPLYPTDERLWALMAALRRDATPRDLSLRTGIDLWFLDKLQGLVRMEQRLLSEPLARDLLLAAKRLGFSDDTVAQLSDSSRTSGLSERVRALRKEWGIVPSYKMVDTCAAEFTSATPYFYSTYEAENEATPLPGPKAVVISSGPIRIGQGIEFDYCAVHAAWALDGAGYKSILVNSNPETVSTDFDTSDRLYFEPLDEESLRNIIENEAIEGSPDDLPGSITQFGGQTAINLAGPLTRAGLPMLGSSAETIDVAEDRRRFEALLSGLGIPQPPGATVTQVKDAFPVADAIGYPVLVRPSYVLGGRAMEIVYNRDDLERYMANAVELSDGKPILIDKYLEGKEVEVDALCDGEQVLIPGVMEHIERTGVHSGDSMAVYPGINLTSVEVDTLVEYTTRMGLALNVRGLMNVQYAIIASTDDGPSRVYVIEVNPRASRTVPFLSKVTTVPMVRIAINIMLGKTLAEQGYPAGLWKRQGLVAIKAPVFSMSKLSGVDTYLGPEMKSTGEVMGVDSTFDAAMAKALLGAGMMLRPDSAILVSIADRDKPEATPLLQRLAEIGCALYATEGTAAYLHGLGIEVTMVPAKIGVGHPDVVDVIRDRKVTAVMNTVTGDRTPLRDGFEIRRAAAEMHIPCFTSLDTMAAAVRSLSKEGAAYNVQPLKEYIEAGRS
ncbi:MAG: carbamoyl-phosphate synthase large subunit [Dehalococcoidia bacterium]|nr:carbamoyl-phosphate synthase large subunit [Dehalococcoidia bacterium]